MPRMLTVVLGTRRRSLTEVLVKHWAVPLGWRDWDDSRVYKMVFKDLMIGK